MDTRPLNGQLAGNERLAHHHNHHEHDVKNHNRAFTGGVLLSAVFVCVAAGYGFFAGSLALLAAAADSLGVVIAGLVMMHTGWFIVDPVISTPIVLIIFVGIFGLCRDSFNLTGDAVPRHIDIDKITRYLSGVETVCHFHGLHIWALRTTETVLAVHMVVNRDSILKDFLEIIQKYLYDFCGIEQATIQFEWPAANHMAHDPQCA